MSLKPTLKAAAAANLATKTDLQVGMEIGDLPRPLGLRRMLGIDGHHTAAGHFRPLNSVKLKIREPRIREIFWCSFTGSMYPEFGKRRPVLVISKNNPLGSQSIVAPLTTAEENESYPFAVKLLANPNRDNDAASFVVADHIYTMSHYRFERFKDRTGELYNPRLGKAEFKKILKVLCTTLPLEVLDAEEEAS